MRAGWEALGVGRRGWQACCGSGCVGGLRASRPARWFKGWSVRQGQGVVLKARGLPSFLTLPFEQVQSAAYAALELVEPCPEIRSVEKNGDRITGVKERSSASEHSVGLNMQTVASVPPEWSLSPEKGEKHLLTLQTVCLKAEEKDLEGLCQKTTHLQKGVAMAAGAVVLQPAVQQGQGVLHNVPAGMAVSVQEGIRVFYDVGLAQINVLQEKGQANSSESEPTEKPPDMLLIEVQVLDVVKMAIC